MASKLWSLGRRTAQPFVRQFANTTLSANNIIEILKEQGLSYRRTEMLADLRTWRTFRTNRAPIARLRPETKVPRSYMVETEWALAGKFRYEFTAEFRDPRTGATFQLDKSMAHDKWLSTEEAESEFEDTAPWEDYAEMLVGGTMTLVGGAYRPDAWD